VANASLKLSEKDLRQWKLVADFREALARTVKPEPSGSWQDPRRRLELSDYLSLFLLGLLNPVVKTTRALCSASHLERVQQDVCGRPVSLGAFSEAQHLVDPAVLERLFSHLVQQIPSLPPSDPRLAVHQWLARDSSLFRALPRMAWALYGGGRAGYPNQAVRLQLSFHLLADKPAQSQVTLGQVCEPKSWQEQWETGAGYVGDRYFSKNFQLFGALQERGCAYVIRLIEEATVNIEELLPVSPADRHQGVVKQAWATLGTAEHRSARLRVVWIEGEHQALMLVTNLGPEELPAELVSMLYRWRWQIESFFKWLKCLLGCRHWLAESPQGVQVQLYLALIASVLLQLFLGRRPNKRMLELIQLMQMGVASVEEVMAGLKREQQREEQRKKLGR
jgi:hypothetical protein